MLAKECENVTEGSFNFLDLYGAHSCSNLRRRNERERVRVKFVNEAFDILRGKPFLNSNIHNCDKRLE